YLHLVTIPAGRPLPEEIAHGPNEVMLGLGLVGPGREPGCLLMVEVLDGLEGFLDTLRSLPFGLLLETVLQVVVGKEALVGEGGPVQGEMRLVAGLSTAFLKAGQGGGLLTMRSRAHRTAEHILRTANSCRFFGFADRINSGCEVLLFDCLQSPLSSESAP